MNNEEKKIPIKEEEKSVKKNNKKSNVSMVKFSYNSSDAREVYLAGDFNQWDIESQPMKKEEGDAWKTNIKLKPGRYEYKFFADGMWVEDVPSCEMVPNSKGTRNCVIYVN